MKFDGLFIFLLLSHPKTMNYESILNFPPLSNSKTMNLDSVHLFLLLFDSKRMKSNGSIHSKRSQIPCWLQWKLHFYYFEKSPIIIYNELFVHIMGFCLFIYEIDISQIWNHFIMLLVSFVIWCSHINMYPK